MASETIGVACIITVVSTIKRLHVPHTNVDVTALQAEALGCQWVRVENEGKRRRTRQHEDAIRQAKSQHGIEGVVTGAVESFIKRRVSAHLQRLGFVVFNPLWKHEERLLETLLARQFQYHLRRFSLHAR
jgi:diphthamide synthase (EF-2-diphthine--ammonia ligase)